MKHLIVAILLLLPGLALSQTPLKSGGVTKLVPGPGSRVSRQEVTNGIVGWWKLNEGTGTSAADSSGNGNTGTLTGGPTWTNALYGGLLALSFDGVNDYVSLGSPSALNLTGEMTISAWFNTTSVAIGSRAIIGDVDVGEVTAQWYFGINRSAGKLDYIHGGAGSYMVTANNTTLLVNRWYHAAVVRTGSSGSWTSTFYLNGVADGAPTGTANPPAQQGDAIGRGGVANNFYFPGLLDDIRIYSRALTLAEIQLLFTNGPNNTP